MLLCGRLSGDLVKKTWPEGLRTWGSRHLSMDLHSLCGLLFLLVNIDVLPVPWTVELSEGDRRILGLCWPSQGAEARVAGGAMFLNSQSEAGSLKRPRVGPALTLLCP